MCGREKTSVYTEDESSESLLFSVTYAMTMGRSCDDDDIIDFVDSYDSILSIYNIVCNIYMI